MHWPPHSLAAAPDLPLGQPAGGKVGMSFEHWFWEMGKTEGIQTGTDKHRRRRRD